MAGCCRGESSIRHKKIRGESPPILAQIGGSLFLPADCSFFSFSRLRVRYTYVPMRDSHAPCWLLPSRSLDHTKASKLFLSCLFRPTRLDLAVPLLSLIAGRSCMREFVDLSNSGDRLQKRVRSLSRSPSELCFSLSLSPFLSSNLPILKLNLAGSPSVRPTDRRRLGANALARFFGGRPTERSASLARSIVCKLERRGGEGEREREPGRARGSG